MNLQLPYSNASASGFLTTLEQSLFGVEAYFGELPICLASSALVRLKAVGSMLTRLIFEP